MKDVNENNLISRIIGIFNNAISGNNILEEYYNQNEMTDKLSNSINRVCKDEVPFNDFGQWDSKEGILSFKTEIIEEISNTDNITKETKTIVLQQLFSVIADRIGEIGLDKYHLFLKDENRRNGKALNNGITMDLSEKTLGVKTNGFEKEKGIYKIFSSMYGEARFVHDYITGENSVQEYIKNEYGEANLKFFNLVVYNLDALKDLENKIKVYSRTDTKKTKIEEYKASKEKYEGILDATLEKMIRRKLRLTLDNNERYNLLCKIKRSNYKNQIAGLNIQEEIDNTINKISKKLMQEREITPIDASIMNATSEVNTSRIKEQAKKIRLVLLNRSIQISQEYTKRIENEHLDEEKFK